MSLSRSSASSSRCTSTNQSEISDIIMKLQALLPGRNRTQQKRVATGEIVKEVCNYIRQLHQEVDDLSEKLSELLSSMDHSNNTLDPDHVLRTLLQL